MRDLEFRIRLKDLGIEKLDLIIYPTLKSLIDHPIELDAWKVLSIDQYTGKKDKDGQKIYEKDIIKQYSVNPFSDGEVTYHQVIFGECSWHIEGTYCNLAEYLNGGICTVAGNIRDHKHLLK